MSLLEIHVLGSPVLRTETVPVSVITEDLRKLHRRLRPLLDRAHMFELWFDGRGRIVRMQHYFSP